MGNGSNAEDAEAGSVFERLIQKYFWKLKAKLNFTSYRWMFLAMVLENPNGIFFIDRIFRRLNGSGRKCDGVVRHNCMGNVGLIYKGDGCSNGQLTGSGEIIRGKAIIDNRNVLGRNAATAFIFWYFSAACCKNQCNRRESE
jgi:hypothetical protein